MTKRIFLSILLVTLIALSLSFVFLTAILFPYFESRISDELTKQLNYLVPGTEALGVDYLEKVDDQNNRITLINSHGYVLFDSQNDAAILNDHSDRSEFRAALASGYGSSTRYSSTLQKKSVNCAVLLSDGNVLRLSSTQNSVFALLLSLIQPIMIVLTVASILAGIFAYRLSRKLTKPLNQIDLENPSPSQAPYEELKPLLRRLNHQNRQITAQIQQLQSQQLQFSAITNNMQEGLLLLDSHGTILSHNESATRLLGLSGPLSGHDALSIIHDEALYRTVQLSLNGKHDEALLTIHDRVCHLFANPVFEESKLAGAVLVLLDVTEEHQREALRREFSANVSHELKTPLTSISGIAEIMRSGLMDPADVPDFAGKIYDESQRLVKLIRDIIRVSQLDENSVPQQSEPVELLSLARVAASRLEQAATAQHIAIHVSGVPCIIQGVSSILDEMIFNLCENALKYNRPDGHIFVDVSPEAEYTVLTVRDTGIGIAPQHQNRVFERFYRVDKSHSKAIGGTGLGLSIVKHGAALHHAQISLSSVPDQGTTIQLRFPT